LNYGLSADNGDNDLYKLCDIFSGYS